ncbi:MAG: DUF4032 domain-containing protein [Endomicrobiales bacterium]|nr:DUF4032 domain-containing protein [Endomicrobiales bacterium]
MTEEKDTLIDFTSIEKNLQHVHQVNLGVLQIPIDKIVGSLGRYADFNEGFLFHKEKISTKYEYVKKVMLEGKILPPIKVYQILDNYFVIDGHHRVTVAKNELKAIDIDAEVIKIEFDLELSVDKKYSYNTEQAKDFLIILEEEMFEKETFLVNEILSYPIKVTDLTSYGKLFEEIKDFRKNYSAGELAKRGIIYSSFLWYEKRFLPAIKIIEQERILDGFPNRTFADLYLWIQQHKYFLSQKAGHDVGFDFTKEDFVSRFKKPKFFDLLPNVVKDIIEGIKNKV